MSSGRVVFSSTFSQATCITVSSLLISSIRLPRDQNELPRAGVDTRARTQAWLAGHLAAWPSSYRIRRPLLTSAPTDEFRLLLRRLGNRCRPCVHDADRPS